jgi:hypothetical protein
LKSEKYRRRDARRKTGNGEMHSVLLPAVSGKISFHEIKFIVVETMEPE